MLIIFFGWQPTTTMSLLAHIRIYSTFQCKTKTCIFNSRPNPEPTFTPFHLRLQPLRAPRNVIMMLNHSDFILPKCLFYKRQQYATQSFLLLRLSRFYAVDIICTSTRNRGSIVMIVVVWTWQFNATEFGPRGSPPLNP